MEDRLKEMLRNAGDGAYLSTSSGPRAHRQIMQIAKEMCCALHDKYASAWGDFAKQWPEPTSFAKQFWPHFCDEARATLTKILETSHDARLKEVAYDALVRDHTLIHTRVGVPQVRMDM